ncbi:putative S-adenosyl-L-methionine-dependent methyltransferase [Mycobacterium saskatchewanense]|uniref:S-adenosyl-L-methionine-dependent methyltransferase n=1 Tax=Mycobacterium saskatchewanense TaxID=220927 RepID=A0AAJ3NL60_9MYCO|nr:class I SAM-dependent methyltransferase [Mycobacterium saskatchewanense]ORW66744.1 SAM-dependent methyltransferase [Mycobacterium saskatchewanense]BBX64855.1 putative S-adenosyl-L-methionine-dependent methyltransferase [Mycobacterium saskatchewanense]
MARADGDSWDPASGVGVTATFGATARAVATDRGLLDDPFAEPLVRAVGLRYFARLIDNERFEAGDPANPVTAGLLDILAAHTRYLDGFLADAARAGIRQVVILASGLDTRPYRLWWPPGTTVYEIDRPQVLDFKSESLRRLGATLTANRCAVGIDLRGDWPAALRRVGFDAAQPTAWVAEQLLVGYLPPDAQNRLVRAVSESSSPGSRFAADHMPTWTPGQLDAGRAFVDGWRRRGLDVDLASLTYPGEYRYVPDHLASHGWQTAERNVVDLLTEMGLPELWRGGPDELAVVPRYLTAVKV